MQGLLVPREWEKRKRWTGGEAALIQVGARGEEGLVNESRHSLDTEDPAEAI
jgi:hypothetical protein